MILQNNRVTLLYLLCSFQLVCVACAFISITYDIAAGIFLSGLLSSLSGMAIQNLTRSDKRLLTRLNQLDERGFKELKIFLALVVAVQATVKYVL
jgi:hypothetical protein